MSVITCNCHWQGAVNLFLSWNRKYTFRNWMGIFIWYCRTRTKRFIYIHSYVCAYNWIRKKKYLFAPASAPPLAKLSETAMARATHNAIRARNVFNFYYISFIFAFMGGEKHVRRKKWENISISFSNKFSIFYFVFFFRI